jgi:hypothetical protein
VADFETKLRYLSERGNPVGAEELIERIEADLAGDPLVVVAKPREGTLMTKTQPSPPTDQTSGYRGPAWAVAAFVAVLAVAGLFLALVGDGDQVADTTPGTVAPDAETMTDLEIIEAGVAALYSGDAERAVELFELDPNRDSEFRLLNDDLIRREAAYQAAIGGRLSLDCTEEDTPGTFACVESYQNALTDAIDVAVSPDGPWPVVVYGGKIRVFLMPEHNFILEAVAEFLNEQDDDLSCLDGLLYDRDLECVNLIMDRLDEWAAWYETIYQTIEGTEAEIAERTSIALAFFDARNAYDVEAATALLTPDAHVHEGSFITDVDMYPALLEWLRATGWQWTVDDCHMKSGDANTRCTYHVENAWSRAMGLAPVDDAIAFEIWGPQMKWVPDFKVDQTDSYGDTPNAQLVEVWETVTDWITANHPSDAGAMISLDGAAPVLDARSIDLWRLYTQEFVEFHTP